MDVKQYVKNVTERLTYTFAMDDFGVAEEASFWALGAELTAQDEPPPLQNIVAWADQVYRAPIHIIYQAQDEELVLFRRHVVAENIQRLLDSDDPTWKKKTAGQRREFIDQFEEQLTYLETHLEQQALFLNPGTSRLSIGSCMHIPLYSDRQFWGIYVVGPYVSLPQVIEAKIQILSRVLSRLVIQLVASETTTDQQPQALAETLKDRICAAGLNTEGMVHLLLPFLCGLTGADYGLIIENVDGKIQVIADHDVSETILSSLDDTPAEQVFQSPAGADQTLWHESLSAVYSELSPSCIYTFQVGGKPCHMVLGVDESRINAEMRAVMHSVADTVGQLIVHRNRTRDLTDHMTTMFFNMIRALEAQAEKTKYHTLRLQAFADRFARQFHLRAEERSTLLLTAGLHDIGYAGAMDLQVHHTMDEALSHPLLGAIMVDMLPIPPEVVEGIKTHHEWVDGSGTPGGLKGVDLPWTGKIIGLLEFIVEYIEEHYADQDEDMSITNLLNELIERTGKQFDLLLIPTIIEMLREMEWSDLKTLGEPKTEQTDPV